MREAPRPTQTPHPSKRELVEEERSARLDQTGCQSAPKELGHLNGATVLSVWKQLRPRLGDSDKLGMIAELIELGEPRVRYDPPSGKIVVRVTLGSFRWEHLDTKENVQRLGELFGERLGLGQPAPLEFERLEPEQGGPAADGGGGKGVKSVYEEEIVRLAQRELDARAMNS